MTSLPQKIVAVHQALVSAALPHAFGGALALAWCTGQARGTIDIDINVFVDTTRSGDVLAGLTPVVAHSGAEHKRLLREGQVRLWWDHTPVDVFLDTTEFHRRARLRVRTETFMGQQLPFLSCADLAVFKTFFDRTKDWADLEAMAHADTLDVAHVRATLATYLDTDDPRFARLDALASTRRAST